MATAAGPVLLRPDLLRRPPEKVEALLLRPDLAFTFFSPFFFFFG
jgi:hypothetical protein